VEWEAAIADSVIETHDRIVGKTWREAKRLNDERVADSKAAVTDTLRAFTSLGASLLEARNDGVPLEMAVAKSSEWARLEQLVATGTQLSNTLAGEPLAYVGKGYHRFRRYAPRMLRSTALDYGGKSYWRKASVTLDRRQFLATEFEMAPPSASTRPG
jgi:hypothetical protein